MCVRIQDFYVTYCVTQQSGNQVLTSLGNSGLCWTVFAQNRDSAVPAEGNGERLTDTDLCPCGETQTMSHIVESCPLTKLNGGLSWLHSTDEDAVLWLTSYGSWNAYEKKITHQCAHVRYWYSNSVRSSVRCVPVFYGNGLTYCHNFFNTQSLNRSCFMSIKHLRKILIGSPPLGALNTGGVKKSIFTQWVAMSRKWYKIAT